MSEGHTDDRGSGPDRNKPDRLRGKFIELVGTLPESQREIVVDHYLRGSTIRSVADRQGLTPARVLDLLHESQGQLRESLVQWKNQDRALERRRARRRLLDAVRDNQEWIRDLALDLTGSETAADEVLRGAWGEALMDPPEDVSDVRAWLRDVVHRLIERRGQ